MGDQRLAFVRVSFVISPIADPASFYTSGKPKFIGPLSAVRRLREAEGRPVDKYSGAALALPSCAKLGACR